MSNATNNSIVIALVFAIVFCCCHNFAQARPNHDAAAETRHFKSELKDDGSYKYQFETSNGIGASESGVGGYHASGHSAYYAPDGKLIQLSYTADEHGFHPTGEHLPTPPPVPEAILKSLEYIRAHPHEDEYKGASGQAHSSYHGNKKF